MLYRQIGSLCAPRSSGLDVQVVQGFRPDDHFPPWCSLSIAARRSHEEHLKHSGMDPVGMSCFRGGPILH